MRSRINRFAGHFVSIMLVLMATPLTRCGDPVAETSPQDDIQLKLIGKDWVMQSVTVDGVDQTGVYSGLAIKFTPRQFTTTHGGIIWPPSGTWSFSTTDGTAIRRDDGIEVKVEITNELLRLTLGWTKTTVGSGRIESLKGVNVFTFEKS